VEDEHNGKQNSKEEQTFVYMVIRNGIEVMKEGVKEDHKGLNVSCKTNATLTLVVKLMIPTSYI